MKSSRELILDAALQVASDAGLSETNIRIVAVKAGYSPSLVIRLFHSRAGLVGEMFTRGQAEVVESARKAAGSPGTPEARCMRVFEAVLDVDLGRIELRREIMANAWSLDERVRAAAVREREQIVPVIAEVVSGVDGLADYQPRLAFADCLWSTYVAVIAKRLLPGVAREEILDDLRARLEMLLRGVERVRSG